MRQRRWLELVANYDLDIQYCLGKINVVQMQLVGGPWLCVSHSTRRF